MGPPVRRRRASISSRLRLTPESYREQKTEVRGRSQTKSEVRRRRRSVSSQKKTEVGGDRSKVEDAFNLRRRTSDLCPLSPVCATLPTDAIVFEPGRPAGLPMAAPGRGRPGQLSDLSERRLLQPLQRSSYRPLDQPRGLARAA